MFATNKPNTNIDLTMEKLWRKLYLLRKTNNDTIIKNNTGYGNFLESNPSSILLASNLDSVTHFPHLQLKGKHTYLKGPSKD